jgi:hypothetical protein
MRFGSPFKAKRSTEDVDAYNSEESTMAEQIYFYFTDA